MHNTGMIATIIIVGLGFIWLGYETNWMRVRLYKGKAIDYSVYHMRLQIREQLKLHQDIDPICGWDWLIEHRWDYKNWKATIELRVNGTTHKFSLSPSAKGIIRDIIRINTKPHKPIQEVYQPSHYTWGLAGCLRA